MAQTRKNKCLLCRQCNVRLGIVIGDKQVVALLRKHILLTEQVEYVKLANQTKAFFSKDNECDGQEGAS